MADYYPLLSRALGALSDRSPAARQAVYDRARSALTEQLRSLDPPLSEADIVRERLALDEAVNRIEAEYAPKPVAPVPAAKPAAAPPPKPAAPRPAPRPRGAAVAAQAWPEPQPWPEASPPDPGAAPVPFRIPTRNVVRQEPPEAAANDEAPPEPARERPRVEVAPPRIGRGRRLRTAAVALALVLVIGAIAVAAWMLRDQPVEVVQAPGAEPAPDGERKFNDRVGAAPATAVPAPAPAPQVQGALPVAQRAVLYEENPQDPQRPLATQARVLWRLDNLNTGQGQPLETVVRATVDVPDTGIGLSLLMRRNLDPTLPASHTIELTFSTPPTDPSRAVRDVAVLLLKNEEAARGTPLAGLPVPVKENLFLIGLSNLRADVERNTDLLLKRNWIDLPVQFVSGRRAIVSFEKGFAGEQVIAEAFRQWNR